MWPIIIIFLCITLNAALAAVEIAFVTVDRAVVKSRAKNGDARADMLRRLKEKPERTLSTIQIGITLLAAVSAAVGGTAAGLNIVPFLHEQYHMSITAAETLSVILVVAPITYLSVVIGEITPKALAIRNPYYYAAMGASTLKILSKLFYPIIRICEVSTKALLRCIPFHKSKEKDQDAEDQEYERVLRGYRRLPEKGKEYMLNLGKLEDKTVADILMDWKDVDYITADMDLQEVEDKTVASGHTRMPVVENEVVIGFLNTKELLALIKSNDDQDWKSLIREPLKFPMNTHPLKALTALQKKHMHMAIVQDEEGKATGVITIEDIVEEVLGEIYDEDDEGSLQRILDA